MSRNERFLFTLEAARISCGYSIEEAAQEIGITPEQLEAIEENPGKTPFEIFIMMQHLYGFPFAYMYFGPKEKVFKQNRGVAANLRIEEEA